MYSYRIISPYDHSTPVFLKGHDDQDAAIEAAKKHCRMLTGATEFVIEVCLVQRKELGLPDASLLLLWLEDELLERSRISEDMPVRPALQDVSSRAKASMSKWLRDRLTDWLKLNAPEIAYGLVPAGPIRSLTIKV